MAAAERARKIFSEIARRAGLVGKDAELEHIGLDELRNWTKARLLDLARVLDLQALSKLRKHEIAHRVLVALHAVHDDDASTKARAKKTARTAPAKPAKAASRPARASKPAPAGPEEEEEPSAAQPPPPPANPAFDQAIAEAAKLDLGPAERREEKPRDIPWSYGTDRVTAAAVDPVRLFVYWEVTDPAMERARAALGPGGKDAWLNIRVYDTTGRLFDGTNAHSYLDRTVERHDRQWFFQIGKPTSTAVVEVGLKSTEGYFARIARSGRVDFPRIEPAPWREPEWMTVLDTFEARRAPGVAYGSPPKAAPRPEAAAQEHFEPVPLWLGREALEGREVLWRRLLDAGWERIEWTEISGDRWAEVFGRAEWASPAIVTSWEAGPFTYPVEVEPPTQEGWEGKSIVYRVGNVTHLVSGPWQIVIRNLGARTERGELGRWEVYRWWASEAGKEVQAVRPSQPLGASEQGPLGASERLWLAGSELRLAGASEVWRMGASEIFLRGASERMYLGASEVRLRGASEVRAFGASELRLGGGSEVRLGGASESRFPGASERHLGGASEGAREIQGDGAAPSRYPKAEAVSPSAEEQTT